MAIKNYTTAVEVHKSLGEIQAALGSHGARKIMVDYRQHASGLPQLQSLQKPDAVGRIPKDGREYAGGSYER